MTRLPERILKRDLKYILKKVSIPNWFWKGFATIILMSVVFSTPIVVAIYISVIKQNSIWILGSLFYDFLIILSWLTFLLYGDDEEK